MRKIFGSRITALQMHEARSHLLKTWSLLLLTLSPVFLAATFQTRYWVNIPVSDEWDAPGIALLHYFQDRLTWQDLFAQHNEARLVVPRLIHIAMATVVPWDVRQGMVLTFLSACLSSVAVFFFLRRRRSEAARPLLFCWLVVNFLLFAPSQYENFLCGFIFEIYLPFLCLFGSIAINLSTIRFPLKVGICSLLALVASYSFGHGLLLWLIGLPIAVRSEYTNRPLKWSLAAWYLLYLLFAICAIALYFVGYRHPPVAPHPASIKQAPQIVDFLVVWLGGVLRSACVNPRFAGTLVGLTFLAAVAWSVHYIRRNTERVKAYYPWLALAMFSLGAGSLTAISRVNLGTDLVFNTSYNLFSGVRYNVTAVFVYISLVGLLFNLYLDHLPSGRVWKNQFVLATAVCTTLFIVAWIYMLAEERQRVVLFKENRESARTAIKWITALPNNREISLAYPYVEGFWQRVVDMNRYGVISMRLASEKLRQAISRPPSTDTLEAGHLDLLVPHPNGQYRIAGWARNPRQNRPVQYIVLGWQTRDDSFHPFTALPTGHQRPDLSQVFKSKVMINAGFDESVDCSKVPAEAKMFKAWAVDFDQQQAFPLQGSLHLK